MWIISCRILPALFSISVHLLLYPMLGKILDTAALLKAKITRDELEVALAEATTEDNWQASTSTLHEIASSAYDRQKWQRISEFLWGKLKNNRNWKKILKALNIVQFVLKNGPMFACDQLRYQLRFFKTMESFTEYEGSIDRGAPIRERAKSIVALLQDLEMLEDERLRAHQIREKMSHMTGGSNYTSASERGSSTGGQIPKYESYSNETYQGAKEAHGYYNYGKGNYGDRDEDKKYDHDYFENLNRFNNKPPQPSKPTTSYYEAPEPTQETPKPIEPIAKPVSYTAVQSPSKPKFGTMTQQLLRNKKTSKNLASSQPHPAEIIKPDLSYKAPKDEEQLIDLIETEFVNSRYKFDNTNTSKPEQPPINLPSPAPMNVASKPLQSQQNSNGGLDSFTFLGGPQAQVKEHKPETISPAVDSNLASKPIQTQPSAEHHNIQSNLTPQVSSSQLYSIQPFIPYQHSHPAAPMTGGLPYQPPYHSHQPAYNPYQNYQNPYGYAVNYQPQPFYGQPVGYIPNPAPQFGYPAPANNYNRYYQNQPYKNPYANVANNLSSIVLTPDAKKEQEPTLKEDKQSGSKKGNTSGGSTFGDLTDLSDIMEDISINKQTKPPKKQSEQNNNIKIDPWAW